MTKIPLVVLLCIAALLGAGCKADPPLAAPRAVGCTVEHVIDGDTIVVSCDTNHIRLLAINTPEIAHPGQVVECGGPEAKAYVEARLPRGTPVRLQPGKRDKDRYGRSLRYIWLGDELLNETLVRQGYAERYRQAEDHTYDARIIAAEAAAKAEVRGLWACPR